MAVLNKYKNNPDDVIDNFDIKFSDWPNSPNQLDSMDWPGLIDKRLCNTYKSRGGSTTLLEENYLDEDVLVTLSKLSPKIQDTQISQCYDVILLGPKNGRV